MNKSLEIIEALNDLKNDNALLSRKQAHLIYDYVNQLEKENQELIVNKNVAQAVALDQKREITELKDQVAYFKEEFEGWQSAYEWSQAQNAILKLKNEELEEDQIKVNRYNSELIIAATRLKKENQELKEQLKNNDNYNYDDDEIGWGTI